MVNNFFKYKLSNFTVENMMAFDNKSWEKKYFLQNKFVANVISGKLIHRKFLFTMQEIINFDKNKKYLPELYSQQMLKNFRKKS